MTEEEFRERVNPEQYRVMREKGVENAYSGQYVDHDETGLYVCAACGNVLFASVHKLDAENGYPTFKKPARASAITIEKNEIACAKCDSLIGYTEGAGRYRANSAALDFLALPELDLSTDDSADDSNSPSSEAATNSLPLKTLTLSIGSLAFGIALGAGTMALTTPAAPACIPTQPMQATVETKAAAPVIRTQPMIAPAATLPTQTPEATPADPTPEEPTETPSSTPGDGAAPMG